MTSSPAPKTFRAALRPALLAGALLASGGVRAATLVVCTEASPDSLNAALSTANTSFDVTEQFSDRLVEIAVGGSELRPGLAESWTISPDGLHYTFKLRRGVKWQSNAAFTPGRNFNADDVVFTFNRMLDKAGKWHGVGGGTFDMFDSYIAPGLQAVVKVDDDTVRFDLSSPAAALLNALSIQSASISSAEYAAAMDKAGTPAQLDRAPIGTGPFQLVQFQPGASVRFRAFPGYWDRNGDRAPKVDTLVFSVTPDPAVRLAKLQAGECQVARYPNPTDVDAIRAMPGVVLQEATIASVSYLAMRVDHKPLDDLRVRRALAAAIDLPNLVKAVWQGTGTPTASVVPPSLWGSADTLRPTPYDPVEARRLLAEAGLKDGFSLDLMVIPVTRAYMPNGRRAGEMIQADWAAVGVKARLVTYEWGEFIRRRRNGEGDAVMTGGTWDFPDPSQMLVNLNCANIPGGRNLADWCDKGYSDLIDQAAVISDQAQRAALYRQAQAMVHDQVPIVLFADSKAYVALRREVTGFKLQALGGQPFGGVGVP